MIELKKLLQECQEHDTHSPFCWEEYGRIRFALKENCGVRYHKCHCWEDKCSCQDLSHEGEGNVYTWQELGYWTDLRPAYEG